MTVTEVVETKLDEEHYVDEDGTEPVEGTEGEETETKSGHTVPKGVAVEELKSYRGHKKLRDECPPAVQELLTAKGAFDVYDKFVSTMASEKSTRGPLGKWRDKQFISVLDLFQDEFIDKGVKVSLCKRSSGKGTYRWLEFIDVEALEEPYVPQYDVSNLSGQILETCYSKLQFPNGVAVEELKSWKGRKKLKEKIPIYLEKLLKKNDLMAEYDQLIDHVIESGVSANMKNWETEKLQAILEEYKPMFAAKGVDVFVSHKQEYVSHGQYGGHTEFFRWIEYVDRAEQPSYTPQRNADEKDEACTIM
ncbi:unnamed protein product [Cylindrotheca closterium]|uniref:Uncharacterized protein n=1 Tax=Cylindrotheca closterium TaxID=2856 RepID=A0AAD2PWD7_9STRA|nr:unnamed protein product [Cylindrotheca closterium]